MSLNTRFFDAFALRSRPLATQILRPAVGHDGTRLRELLAGKTSRELSVSVQDLRAEVEGNLWMLAPSAFRYFLPAFLSAAIDHYASVTVFVSELIGALTEPSRDDVVGSLDQLAQRPAGLGLPAEAIEMLRKQQTEWFDSGTPSAIFHERFDSLTPDEGAAVLAFLVALDEAHGADFPFNELQIAIDRHWARYRTS